VAEILAAGGVLWRPNERDVEVAVVHRPRYDDWSLPKGKLEPGETSWAAAAREVSEETGFVATLGRYLGRVSYPVRRPVPATKIVDYVAARARSGQFRPNREVDALRWVSPADAADLLSYPHDVDILRAFTALPADTTTVALIRHAKAGHREHWPGPDDRRPLSAAGWEQVKALRALLPLFGVDRVHSAPLVRCTQTVQQLAEDLGTAIVEEPLLSERGYVSHEPAAVARLHELASAGNTPVICSQGGVIPDLLSRLGQPDAASRKASLWILSFTGRDLVAANYIPKP
jgi:8-oxo-(d)GTP phosphatase